MSNTIFWICGNDETLMDGSYLQHAGRDYVNAAVEVVAAAADVLPFEDYEVDSIFQNWHGGRFHQFWDNRGGVAIPKDATDEIKALADKAVAAMSAKRDEIDAAEEKDDRAFWADEMERDEDCKLPSVIADMIGAGYHTRESVIAALRANDPKLLIVADEDSESVTK